ncbi:MAG TPA: hypothetical protein PKD09_18605 [Aggregatilinea sp.]|uniref:hypothetical protein n=1 Tax=Aggregatilinea sp. TaxID=2806333 RepID=UPI002B56E891|nr:hypothetical protein [Aggregatilinea sp.]HML23674.1 hypothetical protein [Aggregatilinea sp.]
MRRTALLGVMLAILLAACTLGDSPNGPRTREAVRSELTDRLDGVRADQQAALDLWDRVIFGETVSCQDAIPAPDPVALPVRDVDAYPDATPVLVALNAAIGHVRDAASLWNIECGTSGETVSLDMARSGRAAAMAANDPLDEALALLDTWSASGSANNSVQ